MIIPKAYPGDQVFQKKLDNLGVSMSIWEIRMYLLGTLLSPDFIAPSAALEEILLKDRDDEVVFEDEEDHQDFMNLFFSLWNQLTTYDGSSERYPKLSPKQTVFKNREEKESYLVKKGDELSSFFMALDEAGASDYFEQCFDLLKAQMGLSVISDILIDFCITHCDNIKLDDEELDELLAVVDDLHQVWPKSYPQLNKIFLGIRRGEVKLDSPEDMERKLEELEKELNE